MSELKPCPRCKSKIIAKGRAFSCYTPKVIRIITGWHGVTCVLCGYYAPTIAAWNRRADANNLTEALKRNTTKIEEKANGIRAEYIRLLQEKNKALDEELASLREAFLQATRGGRVDVDEKD